MARTFGPAASVALALALALPLGLAEPAPAAERGSNPVENFMRRVFGPPHRAKQPTRSRTRQQAKPKPKPAAPPVAGTGAAAGAAGAAAAVGAAAAATGAAAEPVPTPAPRPETAGGENAAGTPAKDAAAPEAVEKKDEAAKDAPSAADDAAKKPSEGATAPSVPAAGPSSAAEGEAGATAPVPGQPDAVQPAVPAEAKPVEELPVPDARPADAPPPPPTGEAPAKGQAGAEPPKPEDAPNSTDKLKSRQPVIDPATSVVAAAAIEDAIECEAELKRRGAVFTVKPSISEGECGVLRPIDFERSSTGIKVGPNTQMLCRAALALDVWLADSVAPAAKANFPDRKLIEFQHASTYVCRPRASESGISEHARGSAIDIGSFGFDKGEAIGVAARDAGSPEAKFLDAVRAGACGPFKTVLGPGTDPDHATHFHLDIAARRNGATYCK
ncbi:extensin family protein [Aureimonas leprariae]|uniref:Extensin family protein n=1 Tax=Plantimonas leprariae TaxID=2615207 RepID=A0A7V7TV21_9HYPH|nr:extensin family protein [Aureimonas leprariae]KAB0677084.1 extensin family protein [Aureimonas leprariae]